MARHGCTARSFESQDSNTFTDFCLSASTSENDPCFWQARGIDQIRFLRPNHEVSPPCERYNGDSIEEAIDSMWDLQSQGADTHKISSKETQSNTGSQPDYTIVVQKHSPRCHERDHEEGLVRGYLEYSSYHFYCYEKVSISDGFVQQLQADDALTDKVGKWLSHIKAEMVHENRHLSRKELGQDDQNAESPLVIASS